MFVLHEPENQMKIEIENKSSSIHVKRDFQINFGQCVKLEINSKEKCDVKEVARFRSFLSAL